MKNDAFGEKLLAWYEENRRHLPWREDPSPYRVFVSEMMLQQTRVDTVIPYFERFLNHFPDFDTLASASEEEVLVYWQGLGYYSRAKNLHKAAIAVIKDHGGALPRDIVSLRALPGVGEYMSKAISAIAFDEPYVAVDGNLMRVYARLNARRIDVGEASSKKETEAFYQARISHPSSFNQGLMDLGELVCLPNGAPKCEQCPFRDICQGYQKGDPKEYPLPKRKNDVKNVRLAVVILKDEQGRLAIRKRKDEGLLASLYELPNIEGTYDVKTLLKAFPKLQNIHKKGTKKHRFSHIEWTMDVFEAEGGIDEAVFATEEERKKRFSLPTAFSKLL